MPRLELEAPWVTNAGYEPEPDEDYICCDRCRERIYHEMDYYDVDGLTICPECFELVSRRWKKKYGYID